MRDLKRVNAKQPAYMELKGMGMEVFVPMKQHLKMKKGVRVREEVPFIPDLFSCMRHGRTSIWQWKRRRPSNTAGCETHGASL